MPLTRTDGIAHTPWLRSQGLGILCGQATALLLAVGSVVLTATRNDASRAIGGDSIREFFTAPSPWHTWFYLLLLVMVLYAINTAWATWHSVTMRWRHGIRAPRAYAASLMHVAFLFTLLAHLVDGIWTRDHAPLTVGASWTPLPDGREVRVIDLKEEHLPNGGLKQVHAKMELRDADGRIVAETMHYNGPLSQGLGQQIYLLMRQGQTPQRALLRLGEDHCSVLPGASCELGTSAVHVLQLGALDPDGRRAAVRLNVQPGPGVAVSHHWLAQGRPLHLPTGQSLELLGSELAPIVMIRGRNAPGNPVALIASAMLAVGLGLMWRRLLL